MRTRARLTLIPLVVAAQVLAALPALAVTTRTMTVRGTVKVIADVFPGHDGDGTRPAFVFMPDVKVRLYAYERGPGSDDTEPTFLHPMYEGNDRVETYTDSEGSYTLQFQTSGHDHMAYAVGVVLEDRNEAVRIFDWEHDQEEPACMISAAVLLGSGATDANIEIAVGVGPTGRAFYEFPRYTYQPKPLEDRGCEQLAELGYDPQYHPLWGATTSSWEHFAHLAAMYVRLHEASNFARYRIPGGTLPTVDVRGYDAEAEPDLATYECPSSILRVSPEVSDVVNDRYTNSGAFIMRHEYGHHIACHTQVAGPGDEPGSPGEDGHAGLQNATSAAAMSEGLANYLAAAISRYAQEGWPYVLDYPDNQFSLIDGSLRVDDPDTGSWQQNDGWHEPSDGWHSEEFAITSLLWQLDEVLGFDGLWSVFTSPSPSGGQPVETVGDLYLALRFGTTPIGGFCVFGSEGPHPAYGLDCMFIERGFYHDANDLDGPGADSNGDGIDAAGDGEYDNGERVGVTRWPSGPNTLRDATIERPIGPGTPGNDVLVEVVDPAGNPVDGATLRYDIVYESPRDFPTYGQEIALTGAQPYRVPIRVPGPLSHAVVTVSKDGQVSDTFQIEGELYQDSVNPHRPGGVPDHMTDHRFVLRFNQPPLAVAGGPYIGIEGTGLTIDGSGSSDPDGDPLTLSWDLGDGEVATGVEVVHHYADEGTYPVCLTVQDPDGASSTNCTTAEVSNAAPVVDAGADASVFFLNDAELHAGFTDAGAGDGPWAYTIDWGDGSSANGTSLEQGVITGSHHYLLPGRYVVAVCVTDSDGAEGCDEMEVTVTLLPPLP